MFGTSKEKVWFGLLESSSTLSMPATQKKWTGIQTVAAVVDKGNITANNKLTVMKVK